MTRITSIATRLFAGFGAMALTAMLFASYFAYPATTVTGAFA